MLVEEVTVILFILLMAILFIIRGFYRLYLRYRIKQVEKYGIELRLPVQHSVQVSKGRYGLLAYSHQMSFFHYSFVTDTNPYGKAVALNWRKANWSSNSPYPEGYYHVKYLKRGKRTYLIVLDPM